MSVETEDKNGLDLSCCEDQEIVGEVCNEIVTKTEEKSDGEGSGGFDSYVVVSEPAEENCVSKDKPSLDTVVNVGEFDDSCKAESDSCVKQDVTVGRVVDDFVETSEANAIVVDDDDEKVEETKVVNFREIDSVVEQNVDEEFKSEEQDIVESELEMGGNQEFALKGSAGEVVQSQEFEDMISENFEVTKSEDDVSVVEEPSLTLTQVNEVLERETCACLGSSTQVAVGGTDCIYDSGDDNGTSQESSVVTDGEAKEDGDSSYVFIDGVETGSDDTVERNPVGGDKNNYNILTYKEENQVCPQGIVVGSVVCGTTQISAPSTQSSCSVDNTKSEIGKENYSFDDVLTETMNASSELGSNESIESEFGTRPNLSNRESTPNSDVDTLDEKVDETVERKPIYQYLIRVPRYHDDKIGEQIGFAQLELEEITRRRDAIRVEILTKQATCNEYRDGFEAAKSEQRAVYDVLYVKRKEMASVQSTLNKLKNAIYIDEMSDKILNMQHRIEHETISLKEEKQLIREIKQLKLQRQQLILDRQAETQPTIDQKEKLEKSLMLLKKELDSVRAEIQQAEGITNNSKELYTEETDKLRNLRAQFRSTNDLRQEAYVHVQKLKKQLYDKNKHFRIYKDDARKAHDFGFSGDREALHRHCVQQGEKFMELWNTSCDFRNEYLRCNAWSTVRRLGSLDGRSLGPGEHPPIVRKPGDDKVAVNSTVSTDTSVESHILNLEQGKSGPEKAEGQSNLRDKNQTTQFEKPTSTVLDNSSATISDKVQIEETIEEENKKTPEEEELARKEEALRIEAAAAKMREQLLLEERAKAKEAEERKRRNAEKARARAELKAQKEADHKEKERAKKEKRKARKKASKDTNENESSVPSSEDTLFQPTQELEMEEKPVTIETGEKQLKSVLKRPKKPSVLAKQTKTKVVVPPPLRNRSKKRMQSWMWVLLIVLVVVIAAVTFLPNLRHILL